MFNEYLICNLFLKNPAESLLDSTPSENKAVIFTAMFCKKQFAILICSFV